MIFHQAFRVTGVANDIVLDPGLTSTEKVPKTLISIMIQTNGYNGNMIEGWVEKTQITEIPEEIVDSPASTGSTNMLQSAQRINEIPVSMDLAPGQTYQIGIRSGATKSDISGAYVWQPKT